MEIDGRKVAVAAQQLHGAERDEAWRQITAAAPRFAGYQEKTDRELPSSASCPDPAELLRQVLLSCHAAQATRAGRRTAP